MSNNGAIKLDDRLDSIEQEAREVHTCLQGVRVQMECNQALLENIRDLVKEIPEIKTEIAVLKTKSSWVGALGGLIAFLVMVVVEYFRR